MHEPLNYANPDSTLGFKSLFFDTLQTSVRDSDTYSPEYVYKIKIGNYLPDTAYKLNFSFLYTSLNNKSILGLKADWFLSDSVKDSLNETCANLLNSKKSELINVNSAAKYDTFQNFMFMTSESGTNPDKFSYFKDLTLFDNVQQTQLVSFFFSQAKQVRTLNN